jgi:hypothetical protein
MMAQVVKYRPRGSAATDAVVRCNGGLGGALLVDTSLAPSRVNVSSRQSSPSGEKGVE